VADLIYTIRILRQENKSSFSYWQEFKFDGSENSSVAEVLNELNHRSPLIDITGKEATSIDWECGCMVRKCGACAMRINGLPRLACSTFLNTLKCSLITLEPLSKFPMVRDLIVDRSILFDNLKKLNLWLESEAYRNQWTHEQRFQSARCLMCGCCLEICPNFSAEGDFAGAIAAVNSFRMLNEEQETNHHKEISEQYRKRFYERCGKSLACQKVCPVGLPVEELIVRSNAAAIWKK
jgi:succinate dehydrogenase / fumarate reductase iron-sulfur subunit